MTPLLLLLETWSPGGGGRERYAAELAARLSGEGWTPAIYCLRRRAPAPGLDLQVFGVGAAGERRLARAVITWRAQHPAAAVLALFPLAGATHYQLHAGALPDAWAAERASFGEGWRQALALPAERFNLRRGRRLEAEAELCADPAVALMVFSDADRLALEDLYEVPPARITLDRPGVDHTQFHPGEAPADQGLQLLFVGHNFRLKGLEPAIRAVAQLERAGQDPRLTVAGRGASWPFLATAGWAGVADRVRFAGDVPAERMPAIYRAAHFVVHPAFFDPFPRALIEALSCGCPVVTTPECGVSEVLTPGDDGFVIDGPEDVEGIVDAIGGSAAGGGYAALRAAAALTGGRFRFAAHARSVSAWLGNPAPGAAPL